MSSTALAYEPMGMVPKDGTPVRLILENEGYKWPSTAPYAWNGTRWISATSGIPLPSFINVIGWRKVEATTP